MVQEYISWELTRFVGRRLPTHDEQFELLMQILRSGWLQASYRNEFGAGSYVRSNPSEKLSSNEAVRAATVCFCDIPLRHLAIHIRKYSSFGIAFSKAYLIHRGASPVFYVAANAAPPPRPGIGPRTLGASFDALYGDIQMLIYQMNELVDQLNGRSGQRITFKLSPPGTPLPLRILGKLNAFSADLDQMLFAHLKFFDGTLSEEHAENYYMEREWRKVHGLSFRPEDLSRVILPSQFVAPLHRHLPGFDWPITMVNPDGSIAEAASATDESVTIPS
jgi:hypothetical protein